MLVNCVAYQDGRKLGDIPVEQIHDYLRRPGCFVWMAQHEVDHDTLEQLRHPLGLHPLAVEDARHGHQRPKIEEYDDSLFVVLKMIEMDAGDVPRLGEIDVFVGSNYVLSVRSGAGKGLTEVRERSEREPELLRHGPSFVLYALMDAVVDRYFPVLEALEDELEGIEERILAGRHTHANIRALYHLKRKLMMLKHAVEPLLEAVGKLYGGRVPPLCANMQDHFRDVGDHLARLNQSVDATRDMAITALSVNLSMVTLEESQTMKRLAAYAGLVAVPTLIAGIYGMNFQHMPEIGWLFGYPLALSLMAVIDGVLFYRLRKAGWL